MRHSKKLLRVLSFILLQTFIAQQFSYADVLTPLAAKQELQPRPEVGLKFPDSVATLEDAYKNGGDKLFYLIQDAHTNESGQYNLSKALDTILAKETDLKYVFTEAGLGDDSVSFLKLYRTPADRDRVAKSYIKKGLLHGHEYLNLMSDRGFIIWGVEDPELYTASVELYRQASKERGHFDLYLKKIESTTETLKDRILNPALQTFAKERKAYREESLPITSYFTALWREATLQNIPFSAYPHLSLLRTLKEKEESLDFSKANEEHQKAVLGLSKEAQAELKDLTDASQNKADKILGRGQKETQAYFLALEDKLKQLPPDNSYPELFKYFEYLKLAKNVEAKEVLKEVDSLENTVLSALSRSEDEKTLLQCENVLFYLKKLFHFTLTPEEFSIYKEETREFTIEHLTGFLNKKIMDLETYYDRSLFLEKGFDETLKTAESFYELTKVRDEHFIRTALEKMDKEKTKKAVLVTGGFHTSNLKALLKAKGISFVSVTPQVWQATNMKKYESVLLSQAVKPFALPASIKASTNMTPMLAEWAQNGGTLAQAALLDIGNNDPRAEQALLGRTAAGARLATVWEAGLQRMPSGAVKSSTIRGSAQEPEYSFDPASIKLVEQNDQVKIFNISLSSTVNLNAAGSGLREFQVEAPLSAHVGTVINAANLAVNEFNNSPEKSGLNPIELRDRIALILNPEPAPAAISGARLSRHSDTQTLIQTLTQSQTPESIRRDASAAIREIIIEEDPKSQDTLRALSQATSKITDSHILTYIVLAIVPFQQNAETYEILAQALSTGYQDLDKLVFSELTNIRLDQLSKFLRVKDEISKEPKLETVISKLRRVRDDRLEAATLLRLRNGASGARLSKKSEAEINEGVSRQIKELKRKIDSWSFVGLVPDHEKSGLQNLVKAARAFRRNRDAQNFGQRLVAVSKQLDWDANTEEIARQLKVLARRLTGARLAIIAETMEWHATQFYRYMSEVRQKESHASISWSSVRDYVEQSGKDAMQRFLSQDVAPLKAKAGLVKRSSLGSGSVVFQGDRVILILRIEDNSATNRLNYFGVSWSQKEGILWSDSPLETLTYDSALRPSDVRRLGARLAKTPGETLLYKVVTIGASAAILAVVLPLFVAIYYESQNNEIAAQAWLGIGEAAAPYSIGISALVFVTLLAANIVQRFTGARPLETSVPVALLDGTKIPLERAREIYTALVGTFRGPKYNPSMSDIEIMDKHDALLAVALSVNGDRKIRSNWSHIKLDSVSLKRALYRLAQEGVLVDSNLKIPADVRRVILNAFDFTAKGEILRDPIAGGDYRESILLKSDVSSGVRHKATADSSSAPSEPRGARLAKGIKNWVNENQLLVSAARGTLIVSLISSLIVPTSYLFGISFAAEFAGLALIYTSGFINGKKLWTPKGDAVFKTGIGAMVGALPMLTYSALSLQISGARLAEAKLTLAPGVPPLTLKLVGTDLMVSGEILLRGSERLRPVGRIYTIGTMEGLTLQIAPVYNKKISDFHAELRYTSQGWSVRGVQTIENVSLNGQEEPLSNSDWTPIFGVRHTATADSSRPTDAGARLALADVVQDIRNAGLMDTARLIESQKDLKGVLLLLDELEQLRSWQLYLRNSPVAAEHLQNFLKAAKPASGARLAASMSDVASFELAGPATLAVKHLDNVLRFYDQSSGDEVPGTAIPNVRSFKVSSDFTRLVVEAANGVFSVYELPSGKMISQFSIPHPELFHQWEITHDFKRLIVWHRDTTQKSKSNELSLYDLDSGKVIPSFSAHGVSFYRVSSDSTRLIAAHINKDIDGAATLHNLVSGSEISGFHMEDGLGITLNFTRDSKMLVAHNTHDGTNTFYRADSGEEIARVPFKGGKVSPDFTRLVVETTEGVFSVYDLPSGKKTNEFSIPHPEWLHQSEITPDFKRLIIWYRDTAQKSKANELNLYDLDSGKIIPSFSAHGVSFYRVSSDSTRLIAAHINKDIDGAATLHNLVSGSEISGFHMEDGLGITLNFTHDSKMLVAHDKDEETRTFYRADSGEEIARFFADRPTDIFSSFTLIGSTRELVLKNDTLKLYDRASGKRVPRFSISHVRSYQVTPDSTRLIVQHTNRRGSLYNLVPNTGIPVKIPVFSITNPDYYSSAITPDSKRLIVWHRDSQFDDHHYENYNRMSLRDLVTGQKIKSFDVHDVFSHQVSPDSTRLVALHRDNTLTLHDLVTGQEIPDFFFKDVHSFEFVDVRTVRVHDRGSKITYYDLVSGKEIAAPGAAGARLSTSVPYLSPDEKIELVKARRQAMREQGRFIAYMTSAEDVAAVLNPVEDSLNVATYTAETHYSDMMDHFEFAEAINTFGQTGPVMAQAMATSGILLKAKIFRIGLRKITGDWDALFATLIAKGYLDDDGRLTDKFLELHIDGSSGEFDLGEKFESIRYVVYHYLVDRMHKRIRAYYYGGWAAEMRRGKPDQALDEPGYLADMPAQTSTILLQHSRQQELALSKMSPEQRKKYHRINFYLPGMADFDEGHLKIAELARTMMRAGQHGSIIAALHIEDQAHGCKQCGHNANKVLVTTAEKLKNIKQLRFILEQLGLPTMITSRTDAEQADWITGTQDGRDMPFLLGATDLNAAFEQTLAKETKANIENAAKGKKTLFEAVQKAKEKQLQHGEISKAEEALLALEKDVQDGQLIESEITEIQQKTRQDLTLFRGLMTSPEEPSRIRPYFSVMSEAQKKSIDGEQLETLHALWKKLAGLKTIQKTIEDAIVSSKKPLAMSVEQWREFVESVEFSEEVDFIQIMIKKAREIGIEVYSTAEWDRAQREIRKGIRPKRFDKGIHILWDVELPKNTDMGRSLWMIDSGIEMAIARHMAAMPYVDEMWFEQHKPNRKQVRYWAEKLDRFAVDVMLPQQNFFGLLDTFDAVHRKDLEPEAQAILRKYLEERPRNPEYYLTAWEQLKRLGIDSDTAEQLIKAVSRLKSNNASPSFFWPEAKSERPDQQGRVMSDEEIRSFLKEQGAYSQLNFTTYGGDYFEHVITKLFLEGTQDPDVLRDITDLFTNGYLRDEQLAIARVQRIGKKIKSAFALNPQIFSGVEVQEHVRFAGMASAMSALGEKTTMKLAGLMSGKTSHEKMSSLADFVRTRYPSTAGARLASATLDQKLRADFPELFEMKTVNGRQLDPLAVIEALTETAGPNISKALNARRMLLESQVPVRTKYAFPDWNEQYTDGQGNVRSFREVVQGLLDNFNGVDSDLRWRLNDEVAVPEDIFALSRPGLQITGPSEPLDMAFKQFNADVAVRMPDTEDAAAAWFVPNGAPADRTVGAYAGLKNEGDIFAGTWDDQPYVKQRKGAPVEYRLDKPAGERPTSIQRVPSIHLQDDHILINGKPAPAIAIVYAVHTLNTYGSLLKNGSGNYFYQPKIQTPEEALIVEKMLMKLEELMGLKVGTIKIEALYEEGNAGRTLPVIMWVWRHRLIGTNVGRWDYIGSLLEMWKDEAVFPDPQDINMNSPNLITYQRLNALLNLMGGLNAQGEQTGAAPIGGMAAVMLYGKGDIYGRERNNPKALRAMFLDKLRERLIGLIFIPDQKLGEQPTLADILGGKVQGRLYDTYRQSWVATPDAAYVAAGSLALRTELKDIQAIVDGLIQAEREILQTRTLPDGEPVRLLNAAGQITPWVINKGTLTAPEQLINDALWTNLYSVPKGDITIERIQHAYFMAAQYGFQILNGNYAAAIDDYESGLRFMNDLATYRIFVGQLWTAFHLKAQVTKDGWIKDPVLDANLGVIPGANAIELKAGTALTPTIFRQVEAAHDKWTQAFFKDMDDRGQRSAFDRAWAGVIMEVLNRQILSNNYLQHSPRVLFVLAQADAAKRAQILDAVFEPDRAEVVAKVQAGAYGQDVLDARDYVFDYFPTAGARLAETGWFGRQPLGTIKGMLRDFLKKIERPSRLPGYESIDDVAKKIAAAVQTSPTATVGLVIYYKDPNSLTQERLRYGREWYDHDAVGAIDEIRQVLEQSASEYDLSGFKSDFDPDTKNLDVSLYLRAKRQEPGLWETITNAMNSPWADNVPVISLFESIFHNPGILDDVNWIDDQTLLKLRRAFGGKYISNIREIFKKFREAGGDISDLLADKKFALRQREQSRVSDTGRNGTLSEKTDFWNEIYTAGQFLKKPFYNFYRSGSQLFGSRYFAVNTPLPKTDEVSDEEKAVLKRELLRMRLLRIFQPSSSIPTYEIYRNLVHDYRNYIDPIKDPKKKSADHVAALARFRDEFFGENLWSEFEAVLNADKDAYFSSYSTDELLVVKFIETYHAEELARETEGLTQWIKTEYGRLDERVPHDALFIRLRQSARTLVGLVGPHEFLREQIESELMLRFYRHLIRAADFPAQKIRIGLTTSRDGQQSNYGTRYTGRDQVYIHAKQLGLDLKLTDIENSGGNTWRAALTNLGATPEDPLYNLQEQTKLLKKRLVSVLKLSQNPYKISQQDMDKLLDRYRLDPKRAILEEKELDELLGRYEIPEKIRSTIKIRYLVLQEALVRAQYLVGFKVYPKKFQELFMRIAYQYGVDVLRIFDATNDPASVLSAIAAVRKEVPNARIQPSIAYHPNFPRGEKGYADLLLSFTKASGDQANDSVIKDADGAMRPKGGFELMKEWRSRIKSRSIPTLLHTHDTNGRQLLTAAEVVRGNHVSELSQDDQPVLTLDAALVKGDAFRDLGGLSSPFGQINLLDMVRFFSGDGSPIQIANIDAEKVRRIEQVEKDLRSKIVDVKGRYPALTKLSSQLRILVARFFLPGGMYTNFEDQMMKEVFPGVDSKVREMFGIELFTGKDKKELTSEGKKFRTALMPLIIEEIGRIDEDLGSIPSVTPTSQWMGTQAIYNIVYHLVLNQKLPSGTVKFIRAPGGVLLFEVNRDLLPKERIKQYHSERPIPEFFNYLLNWSQRPELRYWYPGLNQDLVLAMFTQFNKDGGYPVDLGALRSALQADPDDSESLWSSAKNVAAVLKPFHPVLEVMYRPTWNEVIEEILLQADALPDAALQDRIKEAATVFQNDRNLENLIRNVDNLRAPIREAARENAEWAALQGRVEAMLTADRSMISAVKALVDTHGSDISKQPLSREMALKAVKGSPSETKNFLLMPLTMEEMYSAYPDLQGKPAEFLLQGLFPQPGEYPYFQKQREHFLERAKTEKGNKAVLRRMGVSGREIKTSAGARLSGRQARLSVDQLGSAQGFVEQWAGILGVDLTTGSYEIVDASDFDRLAEEEARAAAEEAKETGRPAAFVRLPNGNYHANSNSDDVARSEARTFVSTKNPADKSAKIGDEKPSTNNWRHSDEMKPLMEKLVEGSMKGKKMYVVPYLMGQPHSPFAQVGIEITDNRYVALNMIVMTTVGKPALDHLKNQKDPSFFFRGIQSTGDLEQLAKDRKEGRGDRRHFVNFSDERMTISYGSKYGGNALLGKKFHSLRQGSYDARNEGWLAEHMMILEIINKKTGESRFIAGAFPSASGKTNLAMLQPPAALAADYEVRVVGDDIAWLRADEKGVLRAINPENGFFGVVPDTSETTNPNFFHAMMKPNSRVIYTNLARNVETGDIFWEAPGNDYSTDLKGWVDWKGQPIENRPADQQRNKAFPWAHANSRATVPAVNAPNLSPKFRDPQGVPISAFFFGGKLDDRQPLVEEMPSTEAGIYDAFNMIVQATAAAEGKEGVVRPDPNAMTPFMSYHELEYVQHWKNVMDEVRKRGGKVPGFFHVNWFRRGDPDANGKRPFLWPGFGENLRVVLWALERTEKRGSFQTTPLGTNIPVYGQGPFSGAVFPAVQSEPEKARQWDRLFRFDNGLAADELSRQLTFLRSLENDTHKLPEWLVQQHQQKTESLRDTARFGARLAQIDVDLSRNLEQVSRPDEGPLEQEDFLSLNDTKSPPINRAHSLLKLLRASYTDPDILAAIERFSGTTKGMEQEEYDILQAAKTIVKQAISAVSGLVVLEQKVKNFAKANAFKLFITNDTANIGFKDRLVGTVQRTLAGEPQNRHYEYTVTFTGPVDPKPKYSIGVSNGVLKLRLPALRSVSGARLAVMQALKERRLALWTVVDLGDAARTAESVERVDIEPQELAQQPIGVYPRRYSLKDDGMEWIVTVHDTDSDFVRDITVQHEIESKKFIDGLSGSSELQSVERILFDRLGQSAGVRHEATAPARQGLSGGDSSRPSDAGARLASTTITDDVLKLRITVIRQYGQAKGTIEFRLASDAQTAPARKTLDIFVRSENETPQAVANMTARILKSFSIKDVTAEQLKEPDFAGIIGSAFGARLATKLGESVPQSRRFVDESAAISGGLADSAGTPELGSRLRGITPASQRLEVLPINELGGFFIGVAQANQSALSAPQGARLALFDNVSLTLETYSLKLKGQALSVASSLTKTANFLLTEENSGKLLSGISSSQNRVDTQIKLNSMRMTLGDLAEAGTALRVLHELDIDLIGDPGSDPALQAGITQALDQLKHGDKNFRLALSDRSQLGRILEYVSFKEEELKITKGTLTNLFDLTNFKADRTVHYHVSDSMKATVAEEGHTHMYVQKPQDEGFINFAFPLSSVMARVGKDRWNDSRIGSVYQSGMNQDIAFDSLTMTRVVDGREQNPEVRSSYAQWPLLAAVLWNEVFRMTRNWIQSVGRAA